MVVSIDVSQHAYHPDEVIIETMLQEIAREIF